MKINRGVSELWRVENLPLPLTLPMAYTTACTTVPFRGVELQTQPVSFPYCWNTESRFSYELTLLVLEKRSVFGPPSTIYSSVELTRQETLLLYT